MAPIILNNFEEFYNIIDIQEHKNISFHHHLRNGDGVLNQVLGYYRKENVQDINLFPSSIFPSYNSISDLIIHNQVHNITTNYLNGTVAKTINDHGIKGLLRMQTHGGRARSILEGKSTIDIAYIATPYCDKLGNAVGYKGKNKCGAMGYAIADSQKAKITVLVTDNVVDDIISDFEIDGTNVDYIIKVDSIGDNLGIVSGTTAITSNPIGVKIAKNTSRLMNELGLIRNGFSFQSGAGGISLRVTKDVKDLMREKQVTASFFSGGITKYHVEMLEEGLVEKLYDVQCFDLEAVESIERNKNHIPISASRYANPKDNLVIKDLDVVILGATEIDLDFNVNVTTDSHGTIIGGSGGHSDTASESKVCIIVSPLIKGRLPIIKNRVTTITTLGEHVDCFVTERGISINPARTDLIELLKNSKLNLMSIEELQSIAHKYTSVPKEIEQSNTKIGVIEDRTYEIIDTLRKN